MLSKFFLLAVLILFCVQNECTRKVFNNRPEHIKNYKKILNHHKKRKLTHRPITKSINSLPFNENQMRPNSKIVNNGEFKMLIDDYVEPILNFSKPIHRSYDEMVWLLLHYNRTCKNILHVYSIGLSTQNRQLWVAAISSVSPHKHIPGRPEVKLIGNIHGNEPSGRYLLLRLIGHLCHSFNNGNSHIIGLLSKLRLHILPSLNPDGFEFAYVKKSGDGLIGRLNSNGIDLNRNYPDQFFPTKINPEVETVAMMRWMRDIPFILSASFHDGAFVVSYPFDDSPSGQSKYSATPDDDIFRLLARNYADKHPTMHLSKNLESENCTGSSKKFMNGITNGAEWSSLTNTMQDYNYIYAGCMELTISLGCNKITELKKLDELYWENYDPIINYVGKSLSSVHGFVFDENNRPLPNCTISINDRKHDILTATDGDFWRVLLPGTYEITAKLSGYIKSTHVVSLDSSKLDSVQVNFTLFKVAFDKSTLLLGHVTHETEVLNENNFKNDGRESVEIVIENNNIKSTDNSKEHGREVNENELSDDVIGTNNKYDEVQAPSMAVNSSEPALSPNDDKIDFINDLKSKQKATSQEIGSNEANNDDNKLPTWPLDSDLVCYLSTKLKKIEGKLKWMDLLDFPGNPVETQIMPVVGLELYKPDPKATDGTLWGKRYFKTLPNKAYFVAASNCHLNDANNDENQERVE